MKSDLCEEITSFMDVLPDAVVVLDLDGKVISVNTAFSTMLERNPEDVVGRYIFDLMDRLLSEDIERALEAFEVLLSGEKITSFEFANVLKDGHKGFFSVTYSLTRDDEGMHKWIIAIIRDITEQKDTEEALRKREMEFEILADHVPAYFSYLDSDLHYRYVNKLYEQLFGKPGKSIVGQHVKDILGKESFAAIETYFDQVLRGEETSFEVMLPSHPTGPRWMSARFVPDLDEEGNAKGLFALINDITERKQAEEALRESEEKYRTVFENTGTATVIIEEDTTVSLANEGFVNLSGFSREEIEGKKKWTEFVVREDLERMKEQHSLRRKNPEVALKNYEFRFVDKEGKVKDILLTIDMIPRSSKSVASLLDITEQKKAEEKLLKANRLYATLSQINQTIVRERDEQKLFQEICNIAIEFGKFRLAWIGLVDEENKLVKPVAFSGEGSDYLQNIKISINDSLIGKGPTGRAIREGKSVVFNDLENNPDFAPWRKQALEKGYRSSASFPIRLNNIVIGALNVYAVEAHFFNEDEINLLEEAALDISFALGKFEEENKRKQAEKALRESEEKFRTLTVSSPVGMFLDDTQGNAIYINEKCAELVGIPAEEALNSDWVPAIHPDDRERVTTEWAKAVKNGEEFHQEYRWVHADGEVVWTLGDIVPVRGSDGEVTVYIGTLTNITERKQMEKALRESEEKFRGIAERSHDAIFWLEPDGCFSYVSPSTRRISGYTVDELLGKNIIDLVSVSDKDKVNHLLPNLLKGQDIEDLQIEIDKKDGLPAFIELNATPILRDDKVIGIQGIARDITEHVRTEEEMRKHLMKFKIKDGTLYLVEESVPNMAMEAFNDLVKIGYRGVVISRTPKRDLKGILDGGYEFFWVSDKGKENAILPKLNKIEKKLENLTRRNVVLMDRLDYLILKNGFKKTLSFIQRLRESAYLTGFVLLLSVDPLTLKERELKLLEKETAELSPRETIPLPEDMSEILRYVYRRNIAGAKPSYTEICQELSISKPTVRKRLRHLLRTGYVLQDVKGRSKVVILTEKGRALFTK